MIGLLTSPLFYKLRNEQDSIIIVIKQFKQRDKSRISKNQL